jgi:hypothetical protein
MTTTSAALDRVLTRRSARTSSGFRLRGKAHKAALAAHVMTSVGWFGVAVLVAIAAFASAATGDSNLARALRRALEPAVWVSIPMGVLAVATGAVLSLGTAWGFVRHWWLVAKLVAAALVIATDLLVVRSGLHDLAVDGTTTRLYDPLVAHVIALTAATVVSFFKPRGRTPWGRRVAARGAER